MVIDIANIKYEVVYGLQIGTLTLDLDPLTEVKENVMHISTATILEMINCMAHITIAIKYEIMNWLSIGIFTFNFYPFYRLRSRSVTAM